MKDLHVIVRDKVATYSERDGKVVCGNANYQIVFDFDSEWDVYTEKTARFIWGGRHYDVPFTGNTCPMPRVYGATYCLVGVYVDGLETTTPAKIGCLLSVLCAETPPHNEGDKIHADEAKKSADTATNAAQEAKESADRAEEAAKRAEEIADGLEDSGGGEDTPELPTVTASDNGKVLQVVNGAWAAAELSRYLGEHEEVE